MILPVSESVTSQAHYESSQQRHKGCLYYKVMGSIYVNMAGQPNVYMLNCFTGVPQQNLNWNFYKKVQVKYNHPMQAFNMKVQMHVCTKSFLLSVVYV